MNTIVRGRPALACCVLLLPLAATAGEASIEETKTTVIRRAAATPVIDGNIDPAEWAGIVPIEDFHQIQPTEYAPPSQRTQVYLQYDKDAIYIAARLWDTNPITARIMRQGELMQGDDHLGIIISPQNDRRSGYLFAAGPNGVRVNAIYQNISQTQFDWDGIFQARSSRDGNGWTTEVAFPYKTISMDPDSDTWGINFFRVIASSNERLGWVSRNRSQDPSITGIVTGFSGLDKGIGLDLVPSVSVNQTRRFDPESSDSEVRPSLDAFYKINQSLNAALTFNTDFSATEVDDRQVNLTRFNLFFPEKRRFFLKDLDVFEFGRIGSLNVGNSGQMLSTTMASRENARPFFSRTIGLGADGTPVDLKYGGKLSGRIGRVSVGALGIRQDALGGVDESDLFVGRLSANVLSESSVGLVATHGNPRSNLDNSLIGADVLYQNSRLPGGLNLQAEGWVQQTETTGLEGDDRAYGLGVRLPSNTGWRALAGYKEIGANFNPALGFVSERNIRDITAEVAYTHRLRAGRFQFFFSGLDTRRVELLSGGLQSQATAWRALHFSTRSGDLSRINFFRSREVLRVPFQISRGVFIPVGDYSFNEYNIDFSPTSNRPLSGRIGYRAGDFYTGDRVNVSGQVTWRPSRFFRTTASYDFNDVDLPQGDFIVRLMSLRADIVFSSALSWVNLVQYDNVSGVVGINSRFHLIPEDGKEVFLVLNHNLEDPLAPGAGGFQSRFSELTAKVNYTFRF